VLPTNRSTIDEPPDVEDLILLPKVLVDQVLAKKQRFALLLINVERSKLPLLINPAGVVIPV